MHWDYLIIALFGMLTMVYAIHRFSKDGSRLKGTLRLPWGGIDIDGRQAPPMLPSPPDHQTEQDVAKAKQILEEAGVTADERSRRILKMAATDPDLRDALIEHVVVKHIPREEAAPQSPDAHHADLEYGEKLLTVGTTSKVARHYLAIAWRYWRLGDVDAAIRVTEAGLAQCPPEGDRFKNSLAYYYAEQGSPLHRARAIEFATQSCTTSKEVEPERYPKCAATLGYVHIRYAETLEELQKGLSLCEDGRRGGADTRLYFRHVNAARRRFEELAAN